MIEDNFKKIRRYSQKYFVPLDIVYDSGKQVPKGRGIDYTDSIKSIEQLEPIVNVD